VTEGVSFMLGTALLTVVSLASILSVGSVVEVGTVDEEFTRAASVLVEEVGGASFLSWAEVEGSLVAECESLKVTLASEIEAGVVLVDDLMEATTLLSDVVETVVVTAEGVDVRPLEVADKAEEVVAEMVEEVVEAGITSMALVAEIFDLVMIKEVS